MGRKIGVLTVMVLGIALMLWAGWHNLRDRQLAMQRAESRQASAAAATAGAASDADVTGEGSGALLVGKRAPAFTLVGVDGKKVSLSDYRGRPVLLNFWATWCAPCKIEMPWFEQLRSQYAGDGLEILGVAEDDAGKDEIAKVAHGIPVTYPILMTDGKIGGLYGGIEVWPTSFYIDRNGIVVEHTVGLGSKDEIEAKIRKAIGPGPVAALHAAPAGER